MGWTQGLIGVGMGALMTLGALRLRETSAPTSVPTKGPSPVPSGDPYSGAFYRLGLRSGDILQSVNGDESPQMLDGLVASLDGGGDVCVRYQREGDKRETCLTHRIADLRIPVKAAPSTTNIRKGAAGSEPTEGVTLDLREAPPPPRSPSVLESVEPRRADID